MESRLYRFRFTVVQKRFFKFIGRYWPTEQVSLKSIALKLFQQLLLSLGFNTLCNRCQTQTFSQRHNPGNNGFVIGVGFNINDEVPVNFQDINR